MLYDAPLAQRFAERLLEEPHHADAIHLLLIRGELRDHLFEQFNDLLGAGEEHRRSGDAICL